MWQKYLFHEYFIVLIYHFSEQNTFNKDYYGFNGNKKVIKIHPVQSYTVNGGGIFHSTWNILYNVENIYYSHIVKGLSATNGAGSL